MKTRTAGKLSVLALCIALLLPGCGASSAVKGTGIGAGTGAALGAGLGAIIGGKQGAAWGAGIGATLGAASGALIGKKMDKQREELKQIEGAQVEAINDGQASKVIFSSGIFFDTGKSDLRPESRRQLNEFAESLLRLPDTDVKIYGHTDNTGSDAINDPLSRRRAESVYQYLRSRGVDSYRMETQGFGSYRPIESNETSWGRQQNRRVEIEIHPNAKMVREAEEEARRLNEQQQQQQQQQQQRRY